MPALTALTLTASPRRVAIALAIALATIGAALPATADPATPAVGSAEPGAPAITVLSTRPDLVSAGDVRVAVAVAEAGSLVRVTLNGEDVTDAFALRPTGRVEALLEGLRGGENELVAVSATGATARAVVTNHPNGGPIFSGPQLKPWVCQSTAVDEQCNQPETYTFRYRTTGGSWGTYNPSNPPSDVAMTTTDQGHQVPFVVRVETGYSNRDQYRIAVLFDPAKPWEPWAPQQAWNGKVLIPHGASCGIDHQAGTAPSVEDATALGRGFAVMSTALNNAGHNCNVVTQAESLVMAKERIVERYGDIRYTIGTGCSGGSLTQQQVANAYPGIYQGILPACSFPDAWSTGQQLADYHMLNRYFHDPSRWGTAVAWDPASIAEVEGHPNHVNSVVFESVYWQSLGNPTSSCAGVSTAQRYHPQTNPAGTRCTLMDYMINVFGPRPEAVWTAPEKAAGRGFGGLPLDNEGVQYGLEALRRGRITVDQFVDLNAKVGGMDIDTNFTSQRLKADADALRRSYLSGAVNTASNLDEVAIIDLRGPDHGAFHDAYRSWAVRARLEREHGHFRNHVIWVGHVPLFGDTRFTTEGLLAMDRWLGAVEADTSDRPLADKVVANRPADLEDRCSQVPGVSSITLPGLGRVCEHEHVQSRYGTPRTMAGSGIETDVQKCTRTPLRRQDYYPIVFTDAQWATMVQVFADGVCDYSRRGVDQGDTTPWQTYQAEDGSVVYGGRPLGSAPAGSAAGWTSPAFASWTQAGAPTSASSPATRSGWVQAHRLRTR